jgi:ribosomal protein L25 (general stress protein Ctc)
MQNFVRWQIQKLLESLTESKKNVRSQCIFIKYEKVIRNAKKIEAKPIEISKYDAIKNESPIVIYTTESNPVKIVLDKPRMELINIVRNCDKKELIIAKKNQEKIEIITTPTNVKIGKDLNTIIEEKKE